MLKICCKGTTNYGNNKDYYKKDLHFFFTCSYTLAHFRISLPLFLSHNRKMPYLCGALSGNPTVLGQAIQRRRSRADCVSIHKHSKY